MSNKAQGRVHCIGVGGAGMAPLAELLHTRGWTVSGSDRQRSPAGDRLERLGVAIQYGHAVDLVAQAQMVIYSSAIRQENPERRYAEQHGIPQYRRAEIVGDLMRTAWSVAIAGTHGKTTTTALVGHFLAHAGREPTVLVGGEVVALGSNAMIGSDRLFVTEADEFDRSFLAMYPTVAVITNIEEDHLDCYRDLDDIKDAFVEFANRVPFYGAVVVCVDDAGVRDILPRLKRRVITCGVTQPAMVRAEYERADGGLRVKVLEGEHKSGTMMLKMAGEHNVRNALVAAAAVMQAGVAFDSIAAATPSFRGVRRRLEIIGSRAGVTVIDDYAHHPTEISASLAALRTMGHDRVITVFQPHLFSRTRDFFDGFVKALAVSDVVVVVDIYPAREEPIPGVSSTKIVDALRASGHAAVWHSATAEGAVERVAPVLKQGDVVVLMGAGDVNKVANAILDRIEHGTASRS